MNPMLEDFIANVREMRRRQKQYFSTRSTEALNESKKLEKLVDRQLSEVGSCEQESLPFDEPTRHGERGFGM